MGDGGNRNPEQPQPTAKVVPEGRTITRRGFILTAAGVVGGLFGLGKPREAHSAPSDWPNGPPQADNPKTVQQSGSLPEEPPVEPQAPASLQPKGEELSQENNNKP